MLDVLLCFVTTVREMVMLWLSAINCMVILPPLPLLSLKHQGKKVIAVAEGAILMILLKMMSHTFLWSNIII